METPTSQGIRLSLVPLRIHARTGSSGLSAPFCPLAFLLSAYQSEGWLVGAVGIEPTTLGLQCNPQHSPRYLPTPIDNDYVLDSLPIEICFLLIFSRARFCA